MRGVYTTQAEITGLVAAKTLVLIQAPATAVVEILSAAISNYDNETAEQWNVGLYKVATLGTPTGTANTPAKHESGDQAAASTCLVNLSGEPTAYGAVAIDQMGTNNLAGYRYDPLPEDRPIVPPSGAIGLRMLNAPASFNATVQIVFREIG